MNFMIPMEPAFFESGKYKVSTVIKGYYRLWNDSDEDECFSICPHEEDMEAWQFLYELGMVSFYDYPECDDILEIVGGKSSLFESNVDSLRVSIRLDYRNTNIKQFVLVRDYVVRYLGKDIIDGVLDELSVEIFLQLYKMFNYYKNVKHDNFYFSCNYLASKLGLALNKQTNEAIKKSLERLQFLYYIVYSKNTRKVKGVCLSPWLLEYVVNDDYKKFISCTFQRHDTDE